jgi:hypothetical protein
VPIVTDSSVEVGKVIAGNTEIYLFPKWFSQELVSA